MSTIPDSSQPSRSLPQELQLDALTHYIYDHFSSLLTPEERAAWRFRTAHVKQWSYKPDGTQTLEFFRVPEVQTTYPDLMRRIAEQGVATVMRAAADRVLRDNPGKKILHTCAKCGELCRTPKARQCWACGFDWHADT